MPKVYTCAPISTKNILSFTLPGPRATRPMFHTQKSALLAVLGATLLSACSQQGPATGSAPTKLTPVARTVGTTADSLNGLPGRPFGTPLSAARFTGLVKGAGPAGDYATYSFPDGSKNQQSWFARHKQEVPGVFYNFRDGKFAQFQAVAYSPDGQAALNEEAAFLFGPGRELGDRTEWVGQRVAAVLSTATVGMRPARVLVITSTAMQGAAKEGQQAQLRAENQ